MQFNHPKCTIPTGCRDFCRDNKVVDLTNHTKREFVGGIKTTKKEKFCRLIIERWSKDYFKRVKSLDKLESGHHGWVYNTTDKELHFYDGTWDNIETDRWNWKQRVNLVCEGRDHFILIHGKDVKIEVTGQLWERVPRTSLETINPEIEYLYMLPEGRFFAKVKILKITTDIAEFPIPIYNEDCGKHTGTHWDVRYYYQLEMEGVKL